MLKMKPRCQQCDDATPATGEAWICSFECTWCRSCAEAADFHCPNCAGPLQLRPARQRAPAEVALGLIKRRFLGAPRS